MRFGFAEASLQHDPGPRHPESADRLEAIRRALDQTHGATFEHPRAAERAEILQVHGEQLVTQIEELCATGGGALDSDTIVSGGTWEAAFASAGLAIWAALDATAGRSHSEVPFALCRPPGHHAVGDQSMGFCIFNNVAVGAESAIAQGEAEHVTIIDWDVHHANGTQDIFEDRDNVSLVSIHEEGLYPGTGAIDEIGTGPGAGATLNIPLQSGAGAGTYIATMDDIIRPWVERQEPDLLLISAGFDAHRHDPISRMGCTTEAFGLLTRRVLSLADHLEAGIGFVLEGGYGLGTLSESVVMVNDVCNGYEPVHPTDQPRDIDRERLATIREHHGLGS